MIDIIISRELGIGRGVDFGMCTGLDWRGVRPSGRIGLDVGRLRSTLSQ